MAAVRASTATTPPEADGPNAVVTATFAAGISGAAEYACLDDAAAAATAMVTVDILGVAGVESRSVAVERDASGLDLPDARAFQALEWQFVAGSGTEGGGLVIDLLADSHGESGAWSGFFQDGAPDYTYTFAGTVAGFVGDAGPVVSHPSWYVPSLAADGSWRAE